ncbi:MAG: DUF4282 domain-containing protein [Phycisphaerae bacterium]|nr:DUF4282 domain-containing protein [Phycisphaerae bacterium]
MSQKAFFELLFDLSFTEFLATRVIKVLYVAVVVLCPIGVLLMILRSFGQGFLKGLFALIISPLMFLFYVIIARVCCEALAALFRIAENTARLVEQNEPPPASTE